jgi:hypothetical protein
MIAHLRSAIGACHKANQPPLGDFWCEIVLIPEWQHVRTYSTQASGASASALENCANRLVVVHIDASSRTATLRTVSGPVILYENLSWLKLSYRDPVRCPYCVEGDNFKLMKPRADGQGYLCIRSGTPRTARSRSLPVSLPPLQ